MEERELLGRVVGAGADVLFCATSDDVRRTLETRSVTGLLWRARSQPVGDIVAALRHAQERAPDAWTLLRADLTAGAASVICQVASMIRETALVSLCGFDDLGRDIGRVIAGSPTDGALTILSSITPPLVAREREIVVAAALLGRRRRYVRDLAVACRRSIVALERQLRNAGLEPPENILGRAISLHGAWRIEVLSQQVKQAAADMGFGSPQAFSNYIMRHTGMRPRTLAEMGTFSGLLARFAESLRGSAERACEN
jgi:hypothetical protein